MQRKPSGGPTRRSRASGPPARAYHHGDLENALVSVSLELIARRGAEEFSLREAAAACGVVVSAAYKHFASKEALLRAVADLGFEELGDRMEREIAAATRGLSGRAEAEARLVATGRAYVLFASERPHLFRLMYGPMGPRSGGLDAGPGAPAHRLGRLLVRALEDVMAAYGTEGGRVEIHMVIAWALVHGFSMMVVDGVWTRTGKKALDDMIAELGRAVLRSLRP